MLSNKLQRAINFAGKAHAKQLRKTSRIPYIVHPMAVGWILDHYNFDEDVVIAGILHDVLEDTKVTRAQISKEFSMQIAGWVKEVSEEDKSLPWEERKRKAIKHIEECSMEAVAIKSADAIANMEDMYVTYKDKGDKMFDAFKAGKDSQIARYSVLVHALLKHKNARYFEYKKADIFGELQEGLDTLLGIF